VSPAGPAGNAPDRAGRAALAGFAVLAVLLFDPRLFTGGDNVVYQLLARALAEGRGYVALHEPGEPPHALYPPGYPALLAPVVAAGGGVIGSKLLSLASAAAAVWLSARWLAARMEPGAAGGAARAAALALLATNATLIAYSHWMLTEAPFLAVSAGALLLAEREGRRADWVFAALLAAAGFLLRTAGFPLCVAVAWAAWRRRGAFAGAVSAAISGAAVLAWTVRNAVVAPDAPGYLDQFLQADPYVPAEGVLTPASLSARLGENAAAYAFLELPRTVWPFLPGGGSPPAAGVVLGAALLALLAAGALRQSARRGVRAGEVYAALYAVLLAVWAWNGERFLLPLLPLVLSYAALGGVSAVEAAGRVIQRAHRVRGGLPAPPRRLVAAALAVLVLPNVAHAALRAPGQLRVTAAHLRGDRLAGYDPLAGAYFASAVWLGERAPAGSIVVSRKPQFTYWFSGLQSVLYPYAEPDAIEAAVREAGGDYLIFDRLGLSAEYYLRPYLLAHLDRWALIHEEGAPPTLVLARLPDPARGPAAPRDAGPAGAGGAPPDARDDGGPRATPAPPP
jgi:hypothetical protein